MTNFFQDAKVSIRRLRRMPGFALTAILTLALGIGLSTAVFTVANAVLLRRLAVADQDRLVVLWGKMRQGGFEHYPLGFKDAQEFQRQTRSLAHVGFLAYEGAWPAPFQDAGETSRLRRALVSGNYFAVLGTPPLLGRALRPSDDLNGAPPVAVLSYNAWQQRFGGDSRVLGRRLLAYDNGVAYTVVGVMPRGLDYPRRVDVWVPVAPTIPAASLEYAAFDLIGRLRPGTSPAAAGEELTGFVHRPGSNSWQQDFNGVVQTFPRLVLGDVRIPLLVFAVAAGLLLLITCTNVANLLLVRGLERIHEMTIRAALGGRQSRVIAQLVVENTLLALAGGLVGLLFAGAAVRAFLLLSPPGTPRLEEIQISGSMLVTAFGITTLAMLLFGVGPAIASSRVNLQEVLRPGKGQSQTRRARLTAEALVAGQVALAVLILAATGVVARSLIRLQEADLAFDPAGLLIGELAVRSDQYDDSAKQQALLDRIMERLLELPGIKSASPVVAVPFAGPGGWDGRPAAEGQSIEDASANPMLNMEVVAPAYFATLGMPILRGRGFSSEDREGALRVVVVSESVGRLYWPGADPIGKRLSLGAELERTFTVIGVVRDTRYRDLRDPRPSIYFPLRQSFFPFAPMTLAIRTSAPVERVASAIRGVIAETAPGVALATIAPFDDYLDGPLGQARLNALLLVLFAGAAVLLSTVGLYGIMETLVRQRRHELAVRLSLGATGVALGWMVVRRAATIAAIGTVLGLLGATLLNRNLRSVLYQVAPADLATLAGVGVSILLVACAASLLPARSSARINPASALKAGE